MAILKLQPAYKDYLWGGTKLIDHYGKRPPTSTLAESWELSCHPDGLSVIAEGEDETGTLAFHLEKKGWTALGENCRDLPEFPVLIKLIDAKQPLSVQVHPDNQYAFAQEGEQGKTEMWYIIDCEPDAYLYIGFEQPVTKTEVEEAVRTGRLESLLRGVPVHSGDTFLIEAGTVHAIGAGILLAEVQQSSNTTYRLYDYGRVGADGRPRPLHIEKALAVANLTPTDISLPMKKHLVESDYFVVDKAEVIGAINGFTGQDSFTALLVYEGSGALYADNQYMEFKNATTFFIEAGTGGWVLAGNCSYLTVSIPVALQNKLKPLMQPATAM